MVPLTPEHSTDAECSVEHLDTADWLNMVERRAHGPYLYFLTASVFCFYFLTQRLVLHQILYVVTINASRKLLNHVLVASRDRQLYKRARLTKLPKGLAQEYAKRISIVQ